jgi:hypothetical protein
MKPMISDPHFRDAVLKELESDADVVAKHICIHRVYSPGSERAFAAGADIRALTEATSLDHYFSKRQGTRCAD